MTVADLQVPPLHQAAPALHASFDAPLRPHLAAISWTVGDRTITAGILAASHQVVVTGSTGDAVATETVACDADGGTPLADGTTVDGAGLRLVSTTETVDAAALAALVERREAEANRRPDVIVGRFPTHRHAVTVVAATATGWETLHTYPDATGGGTVVHTRTELVG